MDFSSVLNRYEDAECKELSIKEDSAVYRVKDKHAGSFILRLYSREMPVYEAVKWQDCQGLPQVYECRWEEGFFVVKEQFIDGISLQEMIDGGEKMDEKRAMRITAQICRALACLHEKGFIHRDVKPEHVLLTAKGELFLIDLDAAMRIEPQKKNDTRLLGTAGYAAPEQFGLTRSDVRTDVFSVGILLNMLMTGQHPAVLRYRSGQAAEIIQKCTAMNPMDRYQNMEELYAALSWQKPQQPVILKSDDRTENTNQTVSETENEPKADAGKKRTTGKTIAVLAAMLLLCLAGIFGMKDFLPSDGAGTPAEDGNNAENVQNTEDQTPLHAENGELQLYLDYLGGPTFRYNSCAGSQCLTMLTEDNVPVESDWKVYADEQIGWITGWEEEWLGWRLESRGAQPGAEGFVHAQKDGKTYAVRIVVTGYPISAYTKMPSFADMADGYLAPTADADGTEFVRQTYDPQKRVTLYLAVSPSFENIEPSCGDDRVTIEKCKNQGDWPNDKVYKLTFDNPNGGDAVFQVTHAEGRLAFKFTEA